MRAFSLLTLLLPFVAANTHGQCDCWTWSTGGKWLQNDVLTRYICLQFPDHKIYDDSSKRCKAQDGYVLDGDTWETDCKYYGVETGFYPFTPNGQIDTNHEKLFVGAAVGSCPNRD
ncbi:hypothetical protein E4U30_007417 [Claviceps sp. LM220 group G6]|nr:hypothetical protein E4U15_007929 [Claviceps sp. LM218 group G6]KAG6098879.1 hypothetical protein E4U30_007417 [Claviceps sp. LM220 group G6]KAG6113539.1 hypothetical protein E4U14_001707 [Claviceps sp. LM454 group G7]